MNKEIKHPIFAGISRTAFDELVRRLDSPNSCFDFQLENLEPEGEVEDGIFLVTLQYKQRVMAEVKGFIVKTATIKVQKFPDERENIVLPE